MRRMGGRALVELHPGGRQNKRLMFDVHADYVCAVRADVPVRSKSDGRSLFRVIPVESLERLDEFFAADFLPHLAQGLSEQFRRGKRHSRKTALWYLRFAG